MMCGAWNEYKIKEKKIVTKLVLERWFGGFTSGRKWLTICRSDINQLTPVHYSELLLLMATPQQQPAPQQHYIVACCRDGRTCNAHATNQPIQRTVQSFRVYLPSQINKQNIQNSIIDSIFFFHFNSHRKCTTNKCVCRSREHRALGVVLRFLFVWFITEFCVCLSRAADVRCRLSIWTLTFLQWNWSLNSIYKIVVIVFLFLSFSIEEHRVLFCLFVVVRHRHCHFADRLLGNSRGILC